MKINNTEITKELLFNWIHAAFFILLIIAVGLWGINQFFEYTYKVQLIADPCKVCADYNKDKIVYVPDEVIGLPINLSSAAIANLTSR